MTNLTLKQAHAILRDAVIVPQSIERNPKLHPEYPYEIGTAVLDSEPLGEASHVFLRVTSNVVTQGFFESDNEFVQMEGSIMSLYDWLGSEWKFKIFVPYSI